jgi:hypothetical protein
MKALYIMNEFVMADQCVKYKVMLCMNGVKFVSVLSSLVL